MSTLIWVCGTFFVASALLISLATLDYQKEVNKKFRFTVIFLLLAFCFLFIMSFKSGENYEVSKSTYEYIAVSDQFNKLADKEYLNVGLPTNEKGGYIYEEAYFIVSKEFLNDYPHLVNSICSLSSSLDVSNLSEKVYCYAEYQDELVTLDNFKYNVEEDKLYVKPIEKEDKLNKKYKIYKQEDTLTIEKEFHEEAQLVFDYFKDKKTLAGYMLPFMIGITNMDNTITIPTSDYYNLLPKEIQNKNLTYFEEFNNKGYDVKINSFAIILSYGTRYSPTTYDYIYVYDGFDINSATEYKEVN